MAKKNRPGFSHCVRIDFHAAALCSVTRDGTLATPPLGLQVKDEDGATVGVVIVVYLT